MQRDALQALMLLYHLLHILLLHPTLARLLHRPAVVQRVLEAAKQTMLQRDDHPPRLLLLPYRSLCVHGHPHRLFHCGRRRECASEERVETRGIFSEHGNDVDTTKNVVDGAEHDKPMEVDGVFEACVKGVLDDLHQPKIAVEEGEHTPEIHEFDALQGRK